MKELIFNIKWTKKVWAITLVVLFFLLFSLYGIVVESRIHTYYYKLPVSLLLITTIVVCFYKAPFSLSFTSQSLKIKRGIKPLLIPFSEIESVDRFTFGPDTRRVFGSGGFFGYTGTFSNYKLGLFSSYIGDPSNTFYIITKTGKKYGLSCELPEYCVQELRKKIERNNRIT